MDAIVTFWVDCRKWYVTGIDEDGFTHYTNYDTDAKPVLYTDLCMVLASIMEVFEPEKITFEFLDINLMETVK